MRQKTLSRRLIAITRNPYLWLLVVLFLFITFLEELEFLEHPTFLFNR